MTRDEALKRARSRGFYSSANDWIGFFEDLGMLKLDEPKEPITLCGEDVDWNWWLSQSNEFKARAVKEIRGNRKLPLGMVFRIREFMLSFGLNSYSPAELESRLKIHGLKIVEK